uniref:Uncharacterized protein n=1 Tax=Magallana gigas TaxID=29159 RepID=K1Q621_MAGGI
MNSHEIYTNNRSKKKTDCVCASATDVEIGKDGFRFSKTVKVKGKKGRKKKSQ